MFKQSNPKISNVPDSEKINLKERWDNEEWNKLDGAPEEDVLDYPLSRKGRLRRLAQLLEELCQKFAGLGLYDYKYLKETYSTGEIHISGDDQARKQKSVQKLQDLGFITHSTGDKFQITADGRKKLEDMLSTGEYRNPKTRKKGLI